METSDNARGIAQRHVHLEEGRNYETTDEPNRGSRAIHKTGARRRRRQETFSTYIYKVLRTVHSDTGISNKAMNIMNSFMNDIFDQICEDATRLAQINKRKTLSQREVATATRLIIPGELSRHALSEGNKAVSAMNTSREQDRELSDGQEGEGED
ncbi:Histone H2B [Carpediemonas membranifera]|uniref:Histone H2B n=1 Tax=Carpediemonas membranifera TaxID=201153 RepID=A0A8J6E1E7_9EUKA|nr:Histone H2B [Carpediemonas membranifera]|eukprot:KAG9390532.1 Histone H2B [Carpediemonas membranifera]